MGEWWQPSCDTCMHHKRIHIHVCMYSTYRQNRRYYIVKKHRRCKIGGVKSTKQIEDTPCRKGSSKSRSRGLFSVLLKVLTPRSSDIPGHWNTGICSVFTCPGQIEDTRKIQIRTEVLPRRRTICDGPFFGLLLKKTQKTSGFFVFLGVMLATNQVEKTRPDRRYWCTNWPTK